MCISEKSRGKFIQRFLQTYSKLKCEIKMSTVNLDVYSILVSLDIVKIHSTAEFHIYTKISISFPLNY